VPDHIRSDNGALRAVAGALQHDPATQAWLVHRRAKS